METFVFIMNYFRKNLYLINKLLNLLKLKSFKLYLFIIKYVLHIIYL